LGGHATRAGPDIDTSVLLVALLVEEPVILFRSEPCIADDLADEGPHDVL
jgi:hypothetical protein